MNQSNQMVAVTLENSAKPTQMKMIDETSQAVATASSLVVAAFFGKEHKNLLRDIDSALSNVGDSDLVHEFYVKNFINGTYKDSMGREQRLVHITYEGVARLTSKWQGAQAEELSIRYINAFRDLQKAHGQALPTLQQENRTLRSEVKELAEDVDLWQDRYFDIREQTLAIPTPLCERCDDLKEKLDAALNSNRLLKAELKEIKQKFGNDPAKYLADVRKGYRAMLKEDISKLNKRELVELRHKYKELEAQQRALPSQV